MHAQWIERRNGVERRRLTLGAVWRGALTPRRRGGRRSVDHRSAIVDVHPPRILMPVLMILGLCVLDGALTIILMAHGAAELNPIMAVFLPHQLGWFATVKLGLTAIGVSVLVVCSRMRLFRAISGEAFLYLAVACYVALIVYELRLLEAAPLSSS